MPRIPGAQSQISAGGSIQGGRIDPREAGGNVLSAAGAAASGLAEMLERKRRREAMIWREKTVAEARGIWAQKMVELQREAEPGAPEFTERFNQLYRDWMRETLAQAPDPETRQELDADLTRLRSTFLGQAVTFEAAEAARLQVDNVRETLSVNANTVRANPDLLDDVVAQNRELIEGLGEIGAEQRRELLEEQRVQMHWAAVNGRLSAIDNVEDAQAFVRELKESERWVQGLDPRTYNDALNRAQRLVEQLEAEAEGAFVEGLGEQVRELRYGVDNGLTPELVRERISDPELAEKWAERVAHARVIGEDMRRVEAASAEELGAMLLETQAAVETPGEFDDDLDRFRTLSAAIKQRQERYAADPAAYALQVSTRAQQAYERMIAEEQANGRAAPETVQDYVTVMRAEQRRLSGSDRVALLPKNDVGRIAAELANVERTPEGAQQAFERIAALADAWGKHWPEVQAQLEREEVLTGPIAVAAGMTRADQRAAGQTLMRAVFTGRKELKKNLDDPTLATEIERQVNAELEPLLASLTPQPGGLAQYRNHRDAVETLALYYAATQGVDPTRAVRRAADEIVLRNYRFAGSYRVPWDQPADLVVDGARRYLDEFEPPENLLPMGSLAGADTAFAREQTVRYIQEFGQWVTNADETGLVLTIPEANGELTAVEVEGPGGPRPIELTWDELARYAQPRRRERLASERFGPGAVR